MSFQGCVYRKGLEVIFVCVYVFVCVCVWWGNGLGALSYFEMLMRIGNLGVLDNGVLSFLEFAGVVT